MCHYISPGTDNKKGKIRTFQEPGIKHEHLNKIKNESDRKKNKKHLF